MGLLKKVACILGTTLFSATAIVAAKNAAEVKTDEEVGHKQGFYEKYVKRPQDFFCASAAAIVLSPVLAGTALLVRKNLGSPVLFTQERPGRIDPSTGKEKIFKLYKFRTMTDERDEKGELLSDDERLPKFGKLLRSTSLDELPELTNIIKGDMSIVGPRPLLIEYLPYYTEKERHRHDIRPGLTGLAQINGRNAISWDRKLELDVEYVDQLSFLNDAKIVFKTIIKTVKRSDIQVGAEFKAGKFIDQRKARKDKGNK